MTDDQFARRLPDLMQQLAGDDDSYVDDVLRVTSRTSQRPAWAFVGTWLPALGVRDQTRTMRARLHPVVVVIVLIGIIALLAATVLYVGSQNRNQTTLPSLDGPNGWIAYSTSGQGPGATDTTTGSDIYLVRAGAQPTMIASRDGGTTRNVCPAFSPDGTRLAYGMSSIEGRVVVVVGVDANGVTGDVARIAVPGTGLGACVRWSSDGTRVAYVEGGSVVVRGLDGSTSASGPGDPGLADFDPLPDGTQALISPAGDRGVTDQANGGGCGVVVASPDGANAHVTSLDFCPYAVPAWSPDGRQILLMRDVGGAFTMYSLPADSPFDMTTIVSNVPVNGERSWPGWGDVSWQHVNAKPSAASKGSVAFAVQRGGDRAGGPSDIYLVKNGVEERRIVGSDSGNVRQTCPVFSPDGTKLAYSETTESPDANTPSAVVVASLGADGLPAGPELRLPAPANTHDDVCPKWAPDGRSVAFVATGEQQQLWIGRLDGTETQVVASEGIDLDGLTGQFDWSPDGTALVVVGDSSSGLRSSLWIAPVGAGQARLLHSEGSPTVESSGLDRWSELEQPKWSPDGTRIAVMAWDDEGVPNQSLTSLGSSIEAYRADGTGSGIALSGGANPAWSPDGTRLAYVDVGGELVSVTPDLDDAHVIASDENAISAFTWSPDESRLVYVGVAKQAASGDLVSVSAVGDPAPIVLTQQPHDLAYTFSSDLSSQPVFP